MAVKATASVTVFNVSDGADGRMLYATCPTAAATAAKVATVSSGTVALHTGLAVAVCFAEANTAESPTLDVDGTGAKAIWVNGAAVTGDHYWAAGALVTMVYDGARWVMSDVQSVDVGGTNLCPGSNIAGAGGWISNLGTRVTVSNVDLLGQKCVHAVMTSNTTGRIPTITMAYTDWMTLELDTEYVLSAEMMLPLGNSNAPIWNSPLHYQSFFSDVEYPTSSPGGSELFQSATIVEGKSAFEPGVWKRIVMKFKTKAELPDPSKPYLKFRQFIFGPDSNNNTEVYLRNYKFERGNKATAWSPAPEDMATGAELEATADSINKRVDDLDGNIATLSTTANEFSVQLQSAIADLTGDIDTNAENISTITAMVRVTSDNGRPVLGLGSSGSTLAVQLTNEQLSFVDSGQAVAYINGQRLYITTAEVTGMLRLGNFALVPQSDGSLALKLVG